MGTVYIRHTCSVGSCGSIVVHEMQTAIDDASINHVSQLAQNKCTEPNRLVSRSDRWPPINRPYWNHVRPSSSLAGCIAQAHTHKHTHLRNLIHNEYTAQVDVIVGRAINLLPTTVIVRIGCSFNDATLCSKLYQSFTRISISLFLEE